MKRHPIKRFFRHIFKISWWKPNKKSQQLLKEEADKLIGWDKTINPTWSKSWKYFIKRQYPWYGLIELIQFKIIEMRDFMQNHSFLVPEETKKQIKEMTEVIELGYKILADEYDTIWHDWFTSNSTAVTYVYKNKNIIGKIHGEGIFNDLLLKMEGSTELSKVDQWLKENNLTRDDVTFAYSSEWNNGKSDEENEEYSSQLLKQCTEDRKADIAKYFECIGEYQGGWGE